MAVLIGRRAAVLELAFSNAGAYLATAIGVVAGLVPWPALAALVTTPRAVEELRLVSTGPDALRHNRAMARSGQLQFEFALVLVVAFVLSRLLGW
jgi:1,4-dihydroxy-2-naphthoate octaprenyltransferase